MTWSRPLAIEVAGVELHDRRTCEVCLHALEEALTDIAAACELERKTPMKRTGIKRRRSSAGKKYDLAFKAATIVVKLRSHHRCEYLHDKGPDGIGFRRCTWNTGDLPPHHRKRRSQGGSNDPHNLMDLCVLHHDEVHDDPDLAHKRGYLIRSWEPETPF